MINKLYRDLKNFIDNTFFYKNTRLLELEGLRAWAVIMVFNTHFFLKYSTTDFGGIDMSSLLASVLKMLQQGHCGVDLFFMLSGFFIFRVVLKEVSFTQFISNRYARLLPLILVMNIPYFASGVSYKNLIDNLLYLKIFDDSIYLNWVTWSLNYEIYFYLFVGILGIIIKRRFFDSYTNLLAIIILLHTILYFKNIPRLDIRYSSFFWGMLLSKLYIENSSIIKYFRYLFIPFVLLIYYLRLSLYGVNRAYDFTEYILLELGFVGILLSVLSPNNTLTKRILAFKPLRFIGNISYSFYMVHGVWGLYISFSLCNVIFGVHISPIRILFDYIFGFIITTLIASFTYYYLEKPYFQKK
jgi:exopolysaccharide production protein ExoZ